MDFETTKLCIEHKAKIVEEYDQGTDLRALGDDLTEGGWCAGAAVHWLRCKKNGIDFWTWFASSEAVAKVRFVMARQQACNLVPGARAEAANDMFRTTAMCLRSHGLALEKTKELVANEWERSRGSLAKPPRALTS